MTDEVQGLDNITSDVLENSNAVYNAAQITTLKLHENAIGDDGVRTLAAAVCCNVHLQTLILSNNNIGHVGAMALAHALQRSPSMTELYIGWNAIGPHGGKAFGEMLANNECHLQTLDLQWNNIGPSGI